MRISGCETIRMIKMLLLIFISCSLAGGCLSLKQEDLTPIYVIDEREAGGDVIISLEEIKGTGKYEHKQKRFYIPTKYVEQILKDPKLLDQFKNLNSQ